MITEGKGRHAPTPRMLRLTDYELRFLKREAEKRAEYRSYRAKNDVWSNGLKGDMIFAGMTIRRDVRPIFAGMLGEEALRQFINKRTTSDECKVDFQPRKDGDFGIDLEAFGLTMQVKTRQSANHGNLIRRINKHGHTLPLRAHAFAFCQWDGAATVRILGWNWTREIETLPVVPAIVGEHKNIVVPDEHLNCIGSLLDNLTARKEFGQWH